MITQQTLQRLADSAIENAEINTYDGMCDVVCVELCQLIESAGYTTEGLASVRFLGEEPHFVLVLRGDYIEATTAKYVIVDPTIKQFSDLIQTDVEDVIVVESTETRWDEWYQEFMFISDKRIQEFRDK